MKVKKVSVKKPAPKTDTTPYKGHFELYLAACIVAAIVFCVSAWIAHRGVPQWDHHLGRMINDWPAGWKRVMVVVGFIGSQWAAVVAVIVAFAARYYRLALRLAISILLAVEGTLGAKHLVGRMSPATLFQDIHARIHTTTNSFPSGHVAIVTVIFLSLLPYTSAKWRWIIPVVIASVALAQMYVGVGLPLDMLGGFALGTAIVAFIRVLPQPLRIFLRID